MSLKRVVSAVLTTAIAAGTLLVGSARPAESRGGGSEKLWRIGTYLGAAGTGVALAKGRGTWALIGAGATALSYSQWKRQVSRRHRRERLAYYGSRSYYRTAGYRGYSGYSRGRAYGRRRVAHSYRSRYRRCR